MRCYYKELFFDDGTLCYAGMVYDAGDRYILHGQGKEYYDDGGLWYEGDFKDGKRNGKGKLYSEDGDLWYEGDVKDGLPNGKGKLYNEDGGLWYEGDVKDCLANGKGKLYDEDGGLWYEGDVKDGLPNGKGKLYDENGNLEYEGEVVDGEPVGIEVQELSEEGEEDEQSLEKYIEQLNRMIGLTEVKSQVFALVNLIRVRNVRKERGLPIVPMSFHLVFTGNPGTGKTSVARILAKIYALLGVVSKGTFVETDRAGLVAGYLGQTAIKTDAVIQKAKGGVLFIDEAYSLAQDHDSYGMEAIDCLMKRMEDYRDDLVVVIAGYKEPIDRFLEANLGLKSRFNQHIHFENYDLDALMQILSLFCAESGYNLEAHCKEKFKAQLEAKMKESSFMETFSNGRYIRNLFEKLILAQSNRLASSDVSTLDTDALMTITSQDLQYITQNHEFDKTF